MRRPGLGPGYHRLWTATAITNLGDGVTLAAAPLLAASLTRDPTLVAGLGFATTLPWVLVSLPSGAIVDRYDRRVVMWVVDVLRAVVLAIIAFGVAFDSLQLPALYLAMFASGVGEVLHDTAVTPMVPALAPAERLNEANGRLEVAIIVPNLLLGPPVGGLLFAAAAAAPFAVDAVSFALAALLTIAIAGRFRAEPDPDAAPTKMRAEIAEGLRFVRRSRLLLALLAILAVWNLSVAARTATFVLLAEDRLGVGPFGFGLVMGGMAVGGILAGFTGERAARRLGEGGAVVAALALEVVAALVVPFTHSPWVVAGTQVVVGFTGVLWNVVTTTLRQELTPDRLLGRVMSVYRMLGTGALPIGALLGGLLVEWWGLTSPYVLTAAVGVVGLVLVAPMLSRRAIAEARAELNPAGPPAPAGPRGEPGTP